MKSFLVRSLLLTAAVGIAASSLFGQTTTSPLNRRVMVRQDSVRDGLPWGPPGVAAPAIQPTAALELNGHAGDGDVVVSDESDAKLVRVEAKPVRSRRVGPRSPVPFIPLLNNRPTYRAVPQQMGEPVLVPPAATPVGPVPTPLPPTIARPIRQDASTAQPEDAVPEPPKLEKDAPAPTPPPAGASAPAPVVSPSDAKEAPGPGDPWTVIEDDFDHRKPGVHDLLGVPGPARGGFFAGVEGIYARPHFSEATAMRVRTTTFPNNTIVATDEFLYFDYDYEASFRLYAGYRIEECCSEVRFTYTHLNSEDSVSATTDPNANSIPTFWEIQPGPGGTLTSNSSVTGNIYDLDFSRAICLGDDCDACCPCPPWELRWSAGARLADWDRGLSAFTTTPGIGRIDIEATFIGAGLRAGLEGRRYFGRMNQFSAYSTLDMSLLVGQYDSRLDRNVPSAGVNPATTETFLVSTTRTVPVAEIELGVSWTPSPRWTASAGWFVHAWWDMGMAEQQTSDLLGAAAYLQDDANIMSWDGFTARLEFSF